MSFASGKYDNSGQQLWNAGYHGPGEGFEIANAIAVDGQGNVYVTGESSGTDGIPYLTQSPYPNIIVYNDTGQTIHAKIGDEFAFGFDSQPHLNESWQEKHDSSILSLEDEDGILLQPIYPASESDWFLFKALQVGQTQITFSRFSHNQQIEQRIFNVIVR